MNLLIELAEDDRRIFRELTARFEVVGAPKELVVATRQAIADATYFDKREINHNFDYDYKAYEAVKRNLGRLIRLKQLRVAMDLSLELMTRGSHQVAMSDEGMMTEEIEDCFSVVLDALKRSDLSQEQIGAWSTAMFSNDEVGFIARERLESLTNGHRAGAAR